MVKIVAIRAKIVRIVVRIQIRVEMVNIQKSSTARIKKHLIRNQLYVRARLSKRRLKLLILQVMIVLKKIIRELKMRMRKVIKVVITITRVVTTRTREIKIMTIKNLKT
ncbi:hypothetical protein HG443_001615 [Candidatus Saccharibacteria bacterium]|nr:hypothetical protein [Candidatus Saccharibacteria bacterium]